MFDFITLYVQLIIDLTVAWGPHALIITAAFGLVYVMMSPEAFDKFMNMIGIGVEHDENYKYTP